MHKRDAQRVPRTTSEEKMGPEWNGGRPTRSNFRASLPIAAFTLLAFGAASVPGWAQGNPSADQIINSLRPSAGMAGGTRGIRPAMPALPSAQAGGQGDSSSGTPTAAMPAAMPSHPTAARSPATQAAVGRAPALAGEAPSVNLNVQFRTNSAELTPAAMRTLDQLGRALSSPALSGYHFRIEGHTDTVGSADTNKTLSEHRAQSVVEYLTSKYNLDPSRLQAVGMGEDGLLVPTPAQTPDIRNRRVQVVNVGA
jgi:OOP family OmpA-OmpF porin